MKALQPDLFAKEVESLLQKLHDLESEMQALQDSITSTVVSDNNSAKQLKYRNFFEQMVEAKQVFVKIKCTIDLLQQIHRKKRGHDLKTTFATEFDKIEYELMLAERRVLRVKLKTNQLTFSDKNV